VDTITIVKNSLNNPQQLQSSSDNIVKQVASGQLNAAYGSTFTVESKDGQTTITKASATDTASTQPAAVPVATGKTDSAKNSGSDGTATATPAATPKADAGKQIGNDVQKTQKVIVQLKDAGTGLGYTSWPEAQAMWFSSFAGFMMKLLGIFITTLAIRLGAPYWFDILNKAVNIRGAGPKPDEDKKGKSK